MDLGRIFPAETVVIPVESTEKDELFEELVEKIHSFRPEFDRGKAVAGLMERERAMTTGIIHSVAVPHAQVPGLAGSIGAIGISRGGIDYDSLDRAPVHVVFMIIGAENETEAHIQILKGLAGLLQVEGVVDKFMACGTAAEVHSLLCSAVGPAEA